MIDKIHLKNFKALRDTGELKIKPITFLVGPNSSGKTSLIQAILALRQTVRSQDLQTPLILDDDYINLGSYRDAVFGHDEKNEIFIGFEAGESRWEIVFSVYRSGNNQGVIYLKSLDFDGKNIPMPQKEGGKIAKKNINFSIRKKGGRGGHFIATEDEKDFDEQPIELLKFYGILFKKYKDLNKYFEYLWAHPSLLFANMVAGNLIEAIFKNIHHIGPSRAEPERTYTATGASPPEVGKWGEGSVKILLLEKGIREKVREWLKNFEISLDFDLEELTGKSGGSNIYKMMLSDPNTKTEVSLVDVGFGASQILPIIVEGFNAPKNALLMIEEPEIHLHPRAQGTMGDLLVDIAKFNEKKLIVETHCDLLIRRVCKNILQGNIDHTDVIIYYFEPTESGTEIKTITINKNGQFENFPDGFFEESFEEAMEMAELMSPEE
jgi:AAA15 family ATPase/GTPase